MKFTKVLFSFLFLWSGSVFALENFICPDALECPDELLPKVSFWTKILTHYDQNQIVFYNDAYPFEIYSVIDTVDGCRDKNPVFKREFQKLQPIVMGKLKCQRGLKSLMQDAFVRYKTYQPMVVQALEKASLPMEIQYLPFIESAYNPKAQSYLGAAGIWQFMPDTAKLFGLKENHLIDERKDPEASTTAAMRYLRFAFECLEGHACDLGHEFEDRQIWPFAVTSYNYGVGGTKQALKAQGVNFIEVLSGYQGKRFGHAVKNYYASFLAAYHVLTHENQFFPDDLLLHTKPSMVITLTQSITLPAFAKDIQVPLEVIKDLNPKFKPSAWRQNVQIPTGYTIEIPLDVEPDCIESYGNTLLIRKAPIKLEKLKPIRPPSLRSNLEPQNHLHVSSTPLTVPPTKKKQKRLFWFQ